MSLIPPLPPVREGRLVAGLEVEPAGAEWLRLAWSEREAQARLDRTLERLRRKWGKRKTPERR